MDSIRKDTRKNYKHLRVPVLPIEEDIIKQNANKTGYKVAQFLRQLGLGFEVTSIIDNQLIEQLFQINADNGRLGGLLKLWLTKEELQREIKPHEIRLVLKKIEVNQSKMEKALNKLTENFSG